MAAFDSGAFDPSAFDPDAFDFGGEDGGSFNAGFVALSIQTFAAVVVGTENPDLAPVATTPAGHIRRRVKYVVEVDDEIIAVDSIEDAEEILRQAKELAPVAAKKAKKRKAPRIKIKGDVPLTLRRTQKETQKVIDREYERADDLRNADREISLLMQKKLEEEDEMEAIMALLL